MLLTLSGNTSPSNEAKTGPKPIPYEMAAKATQMGKSTPLISFGIKPFENEQPIKAMNKDIDIHEIRNKTLLGK